MRKLRDSEVEQWILREIGLGNDIGSREICVLSRDGVVTLRGTVNDFGNKMAATHAAQTANGVVSVINEITVKADATLMYECHATFPPDNRRNPGLFAKL